MESFRDIYNRFKKNYKTETGGINLYPQFDSDLDALLYWLENDDGAMYDWAPDGTYIPNIYADCMWRPYGEDD